MSTWPSSLPQKFDADTYTERRPPNTVRTKTDIGPGKTRRRFTAVSSFLSGSMTLTQSQATTFEDFFDTVTQGGSDPFSWTHPRTGVAITAQFHGEYQMEDTEGGDVLTAFSVEVLP